MLTQEYCTFKFKIQEFIMNNIFLDFTISFFSKLNVGSHYINIDTPLSDEIDLSLRHAIVGENETTLLSFKDLDPNFINTNTVYLCTDKYDCHFVFLPLADEMSPKKVMIIGPYITVNSSINRTNEICKKNNIPEGLVNFMHQYYSTLPCLSDSSTIENYLITLGENIYGPGNFKLEYLRQDSDEDTAYLAYMDANTNTDDIMARLEYRYGLEEKVIDSISRGDFNSAMHYSTDQALRNIDNRSSSTLRSKKNNLLAFNTVCRKGAERGNVHPIHLDEMSRRMAIKIENMISPDQDREIHRDILMKYCTMVQHNSTTGYSPTMQRVINHISQHLPEPDLTLQTTAQNLSLNKSYLATIFKKETGKTFTEFVNTNRLERAIFLLNTTDKQIQDIASECGIPDVTYFTRIFKAEKGMTPSQYRKMIKQ